MTLSRPVAIGLLVAIVVLLGCLMLSQGGGEDTTPAGATPGLQQPSGTDRPFATLEDSAEEESEAAGTPTPSSTPKPSPPAQPSSTGDDEVDWDTAYPAGTDTRPWDDIDACTDDILPATMIPVVEDIVDGGPYDYDRDGITFQNREGFLPDEQRGYYREFTVETPGLDHRGARRIVTGGGETDPEVWYYTEDHYQSFCEFAP